MSYSGQSLDLTASPAAVYQVEAAVTARDVAAVLFRRKKIICAAFLSVLAGATTGAALLARYVFPPRYASELKFILKKDRFDAVVTPADRAVPGFTTAVSAQEIYSEIELLKGADVMERLAARTGVPLERLQRELIAEPVVAGRNITNLIGVRYSSTEPAEVLRVLSKLPEVYLEKYVTVNRRPAALEYFRSQAETFEQQLRDAEDEIAQFDKEQPALGGEGRPQQAREKLAEVEKQRLEAEASIRDAESRTAELASQLAAQPAAIPAARHAEEPAYLQRLQSELLDLENRRAQARYYRDIELLDGRLRDVRQAIEREERQAAVRAGETAPNPLRASIESEVLRSRAALAGLRARRAALAGQERVCREESSAARLIAAENAGLRAELVRNVKAAEESFLLYRKKYTEAQEAENLDQKRVLNVAVAEWPRAPARADRRPIWFYLGTALLLAAAAGAAAGFGAELLDHSIHTPRQLEHHTALSVLACIPESNPVR